MRPTLIVAAAASVAALLTVAGPACAQANRTFVSGHGSDSNPCSLSAPCRSFAQAVGTTNPGGEVTILDPAGYGPVIITKSISIINDGVGEAGVTTASAGDAITISAGAGDVVNLRGLNLVGGGVGTNGITVNSAGSVNIQNSVIRGFTNYGINMVASSSGTSNFSVIDTTVSNNLGGIFVAPAGNLIARAVLKRVQVLGNSGNGSFGLEFYGGFITGTGSLRASIIDGLIAENQGEGVFVSSQDTSTTITTVDLINCQAFDNFIGVVNHSTKASIFLAQTSISDNVQAGYLVDGPIYSFGNNYIAPNDTNFGTLTPMPQQ